MAVQQQFRGSRHASLAPETSSKSVKLPDPPLLTDSKDPEFEDWLSRMKNKLTVNADYYNIEALKMAYTENRTGGDAAKYLAPRLRDAAVDKFETADEIFEYLELIYLDLNRLRNAKNEFRRLIIRKGDTYHGFLIKFLHLTGEAQISRDEYKDKLNNKFAFDLRK